MRRSKSASFAKTAYLRTLTIVLILIVCAAVYFFLTSPPAEEAAAPAASAEMLQVLVIDVGQGDSILLSFENGGTMLIDAGTKQSASAVLAALERHGTQQIDILIATHPHADHIGGMSDVIAQYDIDRIYMPDMPGTSKTYQNLIGVIDEHGVEVVEAYAGLEFAFGPALCTIVSPQKNADKDANNESVVIFLDYGDTDFLFTGDMETFAEDAVLEAGYDIDAHVLKVAHHGSRSSTSEAFLRAVSPDFAVISCGEGNKYGHPHKEILQLLELFGITTFRTDLTSDILFIANGEQLEYRLSR